MSATTPTTYRWSALGGGLLRMWRAWTVIVPVVLVNAIVQALLVWPDVTPAWDAATILLALVSAAAFGIGLALITASALAIPYGRVSWRQAIGIIRGHAGAYVLWTVVLLVLLVLATAITAPLAVLVVVLLPFVLLAALDGRKNPLGANVRTIGRRFGRWLVTAAIIGLVTLIGSALTGVTQFFLRGSFGSVVVWVVSGLVLSWFTVAWGLIYANAAQQRRAATVEVVDPDLEPA